MGSKSKYPCEPFRRIVEVEGRRDVEEPVSLYSARYLRSIDELCDEERKDPHRFVDEVFSRFEPNSSVLVFGAGHSYNVNVFSDYMGRGDIAAWDFVREAAVGLYPETKFYGKDILVDTIDDKYDYVFTSHTLEHFTRKQLLFTVLPKLLLLAEKSLIVVVPYGNNWESEITHKCRFFENDELSSMSDYYMLIRNGVELVYWLNKP